MNNHNGHDLIVFFSGYSEAFWHLLFAVNIFFSTHNISVITKCLRFEEKIEFLNKGI